MTEFTEGRHPGEVILSEGQFHYSRDNAAIEAGAGVVEAGTVLAAGTNAGEFKPAAAGDTAVAVNIHRVDATDSAAGVAIIARQAELNGACLVFEGTVNTDALKATKAEQLAAVGIIVR